MFLLENSPEKVLLGLLQVTLLVLPLITLVFATIYYYNSLEFILLLLAQPIRRRSLIRGLYLGVAGAFSLAFLLGIGLPLLVFYPGVESGVLILAGVLLSWVFAGLALLVGTHVRDKARGMGVALLLWAVFAFIFDGGLLLLMYQLAEYPIERPVLFLSLLNPVDIARILVIMKTEASALLGLSGAVFRNFFGSTTGSLVSIAALLLWSLLPYYWTQRRFRRMDL
jgi:Cu-processing system permease protein